MEATQEHFIFAREIKVVDPESGIATNRTETIDLPVSADQAASIRATRENLKSFIEAPGVTIVLEDNSLIKADIVDIHSVH